MHMYDSNELWVAMGLHNKHALIKIRYGFIAVWNNGQVFEQQNSWRRSTNLNIPFQCPMLRLAEGAQGCPTTVPRSPSLWSGPSQRGHLHPACTGQQVLSCSLGIPPYRVWTWFLIKLCCCMLIHGFCKYQKLYAVPTKQWVTYKYMRCYNTKLTFKTKTVKCIRFMVIISILHTYCCCSPAMCSNFCSRSGFSWFS